MTVYYSDDTLTLLLGDARQVLSGMDAGFVNCVVTSPPYFGLRDYEGNSKQIGHEGTPQEYVAALVAVFAEVWRVLADDGTLWLNLGDSYSAPPSGPPGRVDDPERSYQIGNKHAYERAKASKTADRPHKNLLGIPWRVAFALQDAGWYLRNAVVWHKPNNMPVSAQDRLASRYEMLFFLTKRPRYWFDLDPIREPLTGHGRLNDAAGRNPGDVWTISVTPFRGAHFAPFPLELPRRCILAGCRPGDTVLDPFSGAGTTALAAQQLGRRAIGIDINAKYHDIALKRMADAPLPFGGDAA